MMLINIKNIFIKLKRKIYLFSKKDFLYWLDPERVLNKKFDKLFTADMTNLVKVGNYWLDSRISLKESSVIYSGGLGTDAEFDIEAYKMYGCEVHIFDPTPSSRQLGKKLEREHKGINFHSVALWNEEKELDFIVPELGGSASAIFEAKGSRFTAIAKPISQLMQELEHTNIDVLKLDIEGAAQQVIWEMFEKGLFPKNIVCEFERPTDDPIGVSQFFLDIWELKIYCEQHNYIVYRLPREQYSYYGIHLLFSKVI